MKTYQIYFYSLSLVANFVHRFWGIFFKLWFKRSKMCLSGWDMQKLFERHFPLPPLKTSSLPTQRCIVPGCCNTKEGSKWYLEVARTNVQFTSYVLMKPSAISKWWKLSHYSLPPQRSSVHSVSETRSP